MKVFLSWSGTPSKGFAMVLDTFLPLILHRVECFYSPTDIYSGQRWGLEVAKQLEAARFGVVCVTRENLHKPWLVFEAGALSRRLETGQVCPLLFDLEPPELDGPLSQFQVSKFQKDEVFRLVLAMNEALPAEDGRMPEQRLTMSFEKWWPDLKAGVDGHLQSRADVQAAHLRSDRDVLDEVVLTVRQIASNSRMLEPLLENAFDASAVAHILTHVRGLVSGLQDTGSLDPGKKKLIVEICSPLRFMVSRGTFPERYLSECKDCLNLIDAQLGL